MIPHRVELGICTNRHTLLVRISCAAAVCLGVPALESVPLTDESVCTQRHRLTWQKRLRDRSTDATVGIIGYSVHPVCQSCQLIIGTLFEAFQIRDQRNAALQIRQLHVLHVAVGCLTAIGHIGADVIDGVTAVRLDLEHIAVVAVEYALWNLRDIIGKLHSRHIRYVCAADFEAVAGGGSAVNKSGSLSACFRLEHDLLPVRRVSD